MKTARQRIVDFLRTKHVITANELSRALHMTPANARHHLAVLIDEGVVEVAGRRAADGRGRPTNLYTLSDQSRQHNLDNLACALLDEMTSDLSAEQRHSMLRKIARRLQGDASSPRANLTQRLNAAVRQLNRRHYQARWEAHTDAPHLTLGHCPYAAILSEHPEMCQLDAHLLEGLLGTSVRQTAKLAKDSLGLVYCRFEVGK